MMGRGAAIGANQNEFISTKRALLQTEIFLIFINCPGGWSQTIAQLKTDGGPGLAWLHVVCGCEAGWT